jgi:hypothetical protein
MWQLYRKDILNDWNNLQEGRYFYNYNEGALPKPLLLSYDILIKLHSDHSINRFHTI